MKTSSGIIILFNNKILLCHPTNSGYINTFGPPKGEVNINETNLQAAIRETKEEVGISILESKIINKDNPIEIEYKNSKNILYKKVIFFIVKINLLSEIGLLSEIVPKDQLQLDEVDYAKFLSKEEFKEKIFFRFLPILDTLKL